MQNLSLTKTDLGDQEQVKRHRNGAGEMAQHGRRAHDYFRGLSLGPSTNSGLLLASVTLAPGHHPRF